MTYTYKGLDLTALNRNTHPTWIFDIDNISMWWANQKALELWDAGSLEELLQRDFTDLSESTRTRLHHYQEQFRKGKVVEDSWTFYPKGVATYVHAFCRGIELPDGGLAVCLEAFSSTHRHFSQNELRMVEAIRHVKVCICLFSEEGESILMNPEAMRTFLVHDSHQMRLNDLFSVPEEVTEQLATLKEKGHIQIEAQLQTINGLRWHSVNIRKSKDPVDGSDIFLFNSKDITKRIKLTQLLEKERASLVERVEQRTEELQEVNRALNLAVQARDRFLTSMSHELRTPLNAVLGYTELILEEEEDEPVLPDLYKHALNNIVTSAHNLLSMVTDLLDLSSLMTEHSLTIHRELQPIRPVCEMCIRKVRSYAEKKQLNIHQAYPDEPCIAYIDEKRFEQMLLYLLLNAVQYTPEQKSIGLRIERKEKHNGEPLTFILTVWDEGIGIEPDKLDELFQPFKQVASGSCGLAEGAGLGLTMAQKLAQLHEGWIEVESTPGKGSAFKLFLPQPTKTEASA